MHSTRNWVVICSLMAMCIFCGCSKEDDDDSSEKLATSTPIDCNYNNGTPEGNTERGEDEDDIVTNSTFSKTVEIQMGTTATIINPYESNGVSVTQQDGDVTIQSTIKEVVYVLSGTTSNGSLKIYSDNKFKIKLNGASITNNDGPAINVQSKKRFFVEIADGTNNILCDMKDYATSDTEDMKAAFFSEGQAIFYGNGTLNVTGNYKHGICSDDYIRIQSGTINITSATDGIHTNDCFIMDGGSLNITAGSDGIECDEGHTIINDGAISIASADDGITASYTTDDTIDPYVTINGGTIAVTTSQSGGEGIESKSTLTINGGDISLNTIDDGMNAGKAIYINDGKIYIYSTTNDAIDSNGTLTITGGIIVAIGSTVPEEAFDCDNNTFKITGGLMIGTAGATSTPTSSVCTQSSLILDSYTQKQIMHIQSSDGTAIVTYLIPKSYSTMLLSTSKIANNTTYYVYTGGSVADGTDFHGLYTSGTYSGGTSVGSFTATGTVTKIGGSAGQGGGMPGGWRP